MKKRSCKTLKNKLCACLFVLGGSVTVFIERDATAFVFLAILGVCLFFYKDNVFE